MDDGAMKPPIDLDELPRLQRIVVGDARFVRRSASGSKNEIH